MNDIITIDTTNGGFYLGCTRNLEDGSVGITVSKSDSDDNLVKVLELKMKPSGAKSLIRDLTEFANSSLEKSE